MAFQIVKSAAVGAVVIFLLAQVFFDFVFAGFFERQIPEEFSDIARTSTNYELMFVAYLLYACMLVFVFGSRINTFRRGALAGFVIGALMMLHLDLLWAARTYLTTPVGTAVHVSIFAIISALGGGVVATFLGKLKERGRTEVKTI